MPAMCLLTICVFAAGPSFTQVATSSPSADAATLRGPSFISDAKFTGSTLAGWHTLGRADWRVENGELIGKATGNGSWLVLDRSYQDTGFYAAFRCTGVCDTGILLRMTKTVAGINGTYLSIRGTEITGENLTLDPQGNIVDREKLENAAGMIRYAPPRLDPTVLPPSALVTVPRSYVGLRNGEWNEIEIILDANIDLPECNTPRPELCCFSGQVLPIARACAGKIDMRPALCECQHRGAADTARASDDQRSAAGETLQINAHVITPKFIANVIKRSCALVRCGELRDGDINKTGLKKSI